MSSPQGGPALTLTLKWAEAEELRAGRIPASVAAKVVRQMDDPFTAWRRENPGRGRRD